MEIKRTYRIVYITLISSIDNTKRQYHCHVDILYEKKKTFAMVCLKIAGISFNFSSWFYILLLSVYLIFYFYIAI